MKTRKKNLGKLLLILFTGLVIACSKDDGEDTVDPGSNTDPQTVAEVIALGDDFETFPSSRKSDTLSTSEPFNNDYDKTLEDGSEVEQRWICTRKKVSVLDGNGEFPLFNTNASIIWPGNLLQGKTLSNATPSDIVIKRARGKISYNLVTGNPVATREVDEIDQGTVAQAMNDIVAQNGDIVPANFDLKVESINSKEQLALEMGLSVSTFASKVSTNFSLNTSSEYSSVLVKLTQAYYTMNYVKPTSLDEVFDSSVTPERLGKFVQADNPATFISSVTYGRIFYMLYESTASAQDMKLALNGAYGGLTTKVEGNVDLEFLREYNNLSIKVIAYGGDAQGTFETVGTVLDGDEGVNNLQNLLNRLGESTNIAAGLPLSYVVNSLEDPSQIVGTKLATEYDVVNCELKGILPPEGYKSIVDLFKDDEDGGGIGAMTQIAKSNILIFNKLGTKYAWYNGATGMVKGIFSITDTNSPLGEVPLDNVGAATQLSDTRIYFFDKTGLSASRFKYSKGDTTLGTVGDAPTTPVGTFLDPRDQPFIVNIGFGDSGNFPFVNEGFGAGVRVGVSTIAFFGKSGEKYALYSTSEGSWEATQNSNTWFNGISNTNGTLFEKVGAAAFIEFSNSTGRYLLANEDGTEIMQYQSTPVRTFEGPWVIN